MILKSLSVVLVITALAMFFVMGCEKTPDWQIRASQLPDDPCDINSPVAPCTSTNEWGRWIVRDNKGVEVPQDEPSQSPEPKQYSL